MGPAPARSSSAEPDPPSGRSSWLRAQVAQVGLAAVITLLVLLFAGREPRFLSPSTVSLIFRYYSPVAILALGMTFVVLTGGIDLSVGYVMMLVMFLTAVLARDVMPASLALAASAGFALALGAVVGAGVGVLRIPPFILTLSTMVGAYGATLLLSGNQSITRLDPLLTALGGASFELGGMRFPGMLLVVVAAYAVAALVLRRSSYGRAIHALGGNREAARLNGLPVARLEASAYVVMAACCWLAAWMQLGINRTADPKVALSDSLELSAIAMVVIGGTRLAGGVGGVGGTFLGFLLLSILAVGLPYLGNQFGDVSWRKIVQAGVILAGALLDALQRRMSSRT